VNKLNRTNLNPLPEVRCGRCNKKLAEGIFTRLNIVCPRCRTLNQLSATSAVQERHPSVESSTLDHDDVPAHPTF
jgi:phage FluMu protein Com